MSLLHATTGKKNCYLNRAASHMRANLKAFQKSKEVSNHVALKQKPYVYLLCYLFISGRVHYK